MKNKVLGGLFAFWGLLMIFRWFVIDDRTSAGAYSFISLASLAAGVLIIGVGLYIFFKGLGKSR